MQPIPLKQISFELPFPIKERAICLDKKGVFAVSQAFEAVVAVNSGHISSAVIPRPRDYC